MTAALDCLLGTVDEMEEPVPTTDTEPTRFRWIRWAVPIAGMVVLSVASVCLVTGSSAQAPTSAQPTKGTPSSPPPTTGSSSTTAQPSAPQRPPSPTVAPDTTVPPVPRGAAATFGTGVSAQITAVEPITAVATAPGDIAGPALAISVSLANGSTEAVDVDNVTVTASDATGAPASPVTGDQAHPFSGSVRPGAARSATYPFRIPASAATGALIVISYRAGVPIATLTI